MGEKRIINVIRNQKKYVASDIIAGVLLLGSYGFAVWAALS